MSGQYHDDSNADSIEPVREDDASIGANGPGGDQGVLRRQDRTLAERFRIWFKRWFSQTENNKKSSRKQKKQDRQAAVTQGDSTDGGQRGLRGGGGDQHQYADMNVKTKINTTISQADKNRRAAEAEQRRQLAKDNAERADRLEKAQGSSEERK